ncbi:MAG: ATP-binding protein [Chloroflexota bacterium]
MKIIWLGSWEHPALTLPQGNLGYLLLLLYLAGMFPALVFLRKELPSLRGKRLALFILLLLSAAFLSNTLKLQFPRLWLPPVPGTTGAAQPLEIPIAGLLLIGATAASLGTLPAAVVALGSGLVRGAFETGQLLQAFESMGFGLIAGFLLTQDYSGRFGQALRQPLLAMPLASLAAWLLRVPILFVDAQAFSLYAFNYAGSYSMRTLAPRFWTGVAVGAVMQLLYRVIPGLIPVHQAKTTPPYGRSLQQRLLFSLVPIMLLVVTALFYAVTVTGVRTSTEQVVTQIEQDARHAADWIPLFFAEGRALLENFAQDDALLSPDPATRQNRLSRDISSPGFFSELLLINGQGETIDLFPLDANPQLLAREELLLSGMSSGIVLHSPVHRNANSRLIVSFMAPLDQTNPNRGALVGRVDMGLNLTFTGIMNGLQDTMGAGIGFLIDHTDRIIAHPDPHLLLQTWQPNPDPLVTHTTHNSGSRAWEDLSPDNNLQRLTYSYPVEGHDWTVVIQMPYEVILRQAMDISTPLLIRLLILGTIASVALFFAARYLMQPVKQLAAVAAQIAAGELDTSVQVGGEDEVGRLRTAFEGMRLSLKERIEQLSLLWQVSQAVSSSLELEESLQPILRSATTKTGAHAARIVLFSGEGVAKTTLSQGAGAHLLSTLDSLSHGLIQPQLPFIAPNLARAQAPHLLALRQAGLRSLYGLPLTTRGRTIGAMWLAFNSPRPADASEMDFLSTLAGQAAVAVQNARLFAAARDGRQRLEAILASASDAIIVTDEQNHLLLANPAAEQAFRSLADARGQAVEKLLAGEPAAALQLFVTPLEGESGVLTEELPLADGRVLYASVCAINQQGEQAAGRVAVLRDITYLKELDQMKSDFVNTVSHDLRSPLTFMRGYVTMIPMVGQVTAKQQEFVDKIVLGIEQMTKLIDDLLNIGRIEAGVDIDMAPCRLDELTHKVVQNLRPRAIAQKLELNTRLPEVSPPPVWGDRVLLEHALTNLVDNAIKYTFQGSVTVGLAEQNAQVVVWVKDTGIGIEAQHFPRLFEKFHRIKRRDTVQIKGTGLGLAIVKSVADLHNGRVWVESVPGKGSTFFFAIPKHLPD